MSENLLTVRQAAVRLRISPYTLRRWLRQGTMRGVKIGHDWRISEGVLNERVRENEPAAKDNAARLREFIRLAQELRPVFERAGITGINGEDLIHEIRGELDSRLANR